MRDLVDAYFGALALVTWPVLMPALRAAHRQARQSVGAPLKGQAKRRPVENAGDAAVAAAAFTFAR